MRRIVFLISALIFSALSALANDRRELELGMTRQEVEGITGQADVVRLERNGVQCFGYEPHPERLPNILFVREGALIAFRAGRLVEEIEVYPYNIDIQCSQIASKWDMPPSRPVTCLRKFWIHCP